MKRLFLSSASASTLLLFTVSGVLAQNSATPSSPVATPRTLFTTKAVEREQKIENRMEKRDERIASREAKLDARKQTIVDRILALARRMLERAHRRIERLDNIWARIESRIEKIKTSGKDVSSLDPLVSDVKTKHQAALDAITTAETKLQALVGTNDPKAAVAAFRDSFKTVKDAIKAYHQAIVAVIRKMKELVAVSPSRPVSATGAVVTRTPTATGGAAVTVVP